MYNAGSTPSVAPKVQGTGMAPRQQAIGRALNKPKDPVRNSPGKGPKNNPMHTNTAFGISQPGHPLGGKNDNTPNYQIGKNQNLPGLDVLGNPATNPTYTVGGQPVAGGQSPTGTGDPELDKYLAGDDVYQNVLSSIGRNKQMNESTYAYNKGNLNTDNETIKRRLASKEVDDNKFLDNDYAARGLFGSGLFAKADTDLGQGYADQYTDLETSLQRNLQQLLTDNQSQTNLDDETLRQAQLDAVTRRAQEFGIFGGPNNNTGTPGKDGKNGKNGKDGKDKKDPPKKKGKGKK